MVLLKSSFASVLVGAALTASASGAALPSMPNGELNARDAQTVMRVPQAPLAPAEQDIKIIANKMGKKMMRRSEYMGDDVDYTQHPDKRLWRGRLGRRGPLRQRQEDEKLAQQAQEVEDEEYDDMRGGSLPGGSEMDLEARGLPARPKQPQAQPQAQPEYQTPKPEESRPSQPQSDDRQQDRPAQGGKKEDLINVDIDGVKGDSPTHGRLVDLDARSWERPAHYHDLINIDLDGVRGDSPVHGSLLNLDARSPRHDDDRVVVVEGGRHRYHYDHDRDHDYDHDRNGHEHVHEHIHSRSNVVVVDEGRGHHGNHRGHGHRHGDNVVVVDKRRHEDKDEVVVIDGDRHHHHDGDHHGHRHGGDVVVMDKRRHNDDVVYVDGDHYRSHGDVIYVDGDRHHRHHGDVVYVDGDRHHRYQGDVNVHEHIHSHIHDKRSHNDHDNVVVVDGDRHGHKHNGHGHHDHETVIVDKRRHNDNDHGRHRGHRGHRQGRHDIKIVHRPVSAPRPAPVPAPAPPAAVPAPPRAPAPAPKPVSPPPPPPPPPPAPEPEPVPAAEPEPEAPVEEEPVEEEPVEEPEPEDQPEAEGGDEGDMKRRHLGRHGHGGHKHGHSSGDKRSHDHDHHHEEVVVVDEHRHHRHRPLIAVDKRQSVMEKVKSFFTARSHNDDTTIVKTGGHRHDTTIVKTGRHGDTVVKTGRHGDTVVVDGHHKRHSTKINVIGDDREYADTVIYQDGRHHQHGRPIYIESGHSRDGVRIIPRGEMEEEELAPLYKRSHDNDDNHGHHGHGHHGGRHRNCRNGGCDDEDITIVTNHKRDMGMGGAPGYIDVTSPMANSTSAQKIASLVLSTSNGTDSNSTFVFNASNNIRTQVYLVPINTTSTDAGSADSTSPIAVNLKLPIFNAASAAVEPYCATFDPSPASPAPMTVMPCMAENDIHQSQTFLYYSDSGVIHPDWKPAATSQDLLQSMSDSVDDTDENMMNIDEVVSASSSMAASSSSAPSSTSMASSSMMTSMTSMSSASATASSAFKTSTSTSMPAVTSMSSSTSSIPNLPTLIASSASSLGAAAITPTASASGSVSSSAPSSIPTGSPSNVTLIFSPANPSINSESMMTSDSDMAQAAFDAPSSEVDAEKVKATPSASSTDSTSSTAPSSTSSAGPKRYPVTPLPSASPIDAEAYNGQDASDQTLSDDEPTMDTMGTDDAETATTSGQDFTAPYQRR